MSYTLHLYAVSIEMLRGVITGRNEIPLKTLTLVPPEVFAPHVDRVSIESALELLRPADSFPKQHADQQVYAFESLCAAFGEQLRTTSFENARAAYIDEVLGELPFGKYLIEPRSPVPIAQDDGFPIVGHLTAKEVGEILISADLDTSDEQAAEIRSAREEVRDVLEYVQRLRTDLVAFYY